MRIKCENAIGLSTKSERLQSSWKENSTRLNICSESAQLGPIEFFERCLLTGLVAFNHLPEITFRFNVILIFVVCKPFLHNGQGALNGAAAGGTLTNLKLRG